MSKVAIAIVTVVIIVVYYAVRQNYERSMSLRTTFTEIMSVLEPEFTETPRLHKVSGLPTGYNNNPGMIVWNGDRYSYTIKGPHDRVIMSFNNSHVYPFFFMKSYMGRLNLDTYEVDALRQISTSSIKQEDMRLFSFDNRLCGSFTRVWSSMNPFNTYLLNKQGIWDFQKNKDYVPRLNYAISEGHFEKNWQFFQDGNRHLIIYKVQPFTVYRANPWTFEAEEKIKEHEWSAGKLSFRCSAPPIWVGDRWFMLVHTKDYRIHFITFSKELIPLQYSSVPICETEQCAYNIYFPCGCLWDEVKGKFIISLGINNVSLGLLDVPMEEVRKGLVYIS
jgi:hypothetical protein